MTRKLVDGSAEIQEKSRAPYSFTAVNLDWYTNSTVAALFEELTEEDISYTYISEGYCTYEDNIKMDLGETG
jgi:hypothetical protein